MQFSIDFSTSQFGHFDKTLGISNLTTCNRYISVNKGRPMRAAQQPPNISLARANLAGAQAPHSHVHPTSCVKLEPETFRYRPHLAHQQHNWQTDPRLSCIRRWLDLHYWIVRCDGGVGDSMMMVVVLVTV